MNFESKFDIGDAVMIDADKSVIGYVVALRWSREDRPQYEVSWMHEGRAEYVYFDEWRLSK
jgi:hypothetical protein